MWSSSSDIGYGDKFINSIGVAVTDGRDSASSRSSRLISVVVEDLMAVAKRVSSV